MLTMLASGFWHGPNWQMLLWGALHGFYLVAERLITLSRPPHPKGQKIHWTSRASTLITFLLVALAWVPFTMRIPNAVHFWQQLFAGNLFGMRDSQLLFPLTVLIPAIWLDWIQYDKAEEVFFLRQKQVVQAALLATAIVLILVVTSSGAGQPFVYQAF